MQFYFIHWLTVVGSNGFDWTQSALDADHIRIDLTLSLEGNLFKILFLNFWRFTDVMYLYWTSVFIMQLRISFRVEENICGIRNISKYVLRTIFQVYKLTRKIVSKTERHLRMFEKAGFRSSLLRENTKTHKMLPARMTNSVTVQLKIKAILPIFFFLLFRSI